DGAGRPSNAGSASACAMPGGIFAPDVRPPPTCVQHTVATCAPEPATTAILSPKVIEPQMPDWYRDSPAVNTERYLPTFRGCGSMARSDAIRKANWYDIRFFIFGNERDLTTRLLNLG